MNDNCNDLSPFHSFNTIILLRMISSKLIGNVCSKVQVLLDRYTSLNKSIKQQTVLKESTSLCLSIPFHFYFIPFSFLSIFTRSIPIHSYPFLSIPIHSYPFRIKSFHSYAIASELASFDWDTFQALLSLLLFLDAFLQVLHRSHHTVLSFFSDNRDLLLELSSGGTMPKELSLSAMDFVLLEMQSKEESWQSSVLNVCVEKRQDG